MKHNIETDDYKWLTEIEPELYSDKPCKYQIRSKEWGLYSKRDATIICEFLQRAGMDIIYDGI